MITLGLDSSEAHGGAALVRDGVLLGEVLLEGPLRHSEELLPAGERLIDSCGIERREIARVSVNRGPGSFTGLRIGLSSAKGFGQALGIPVRGVDGTVAYRMRVASRRVCVIVANRRELFYVRWFAGEKPRDAGVRVLTRRELLDRLRQETKELTAVGSGVEALRPELSEMPQVVLAPPELNRPSPAWIARLGEEMGEGDELYTLEPLYVEPAIRKLAA